MILETIHAPEQVRALSEEECKVLCEELRTFLVREVSQTGGHLASNLGVVELTVALHRVFDTREDKLVFDVGHQCYVHKILTGRMEQFSTLRQFEGLSGFPKPYESEHDAFIAGHASNSVSVALGMARAIRLQGKQGHAIALIGDGAMTGGLAFEGLNDTGASKEPLLVILNDNGMSIRPNVGALSQHLTDLRTKPAYYRFKSWYRAKAMRGKLGRKVYAMTHSVKAGLKQHIWPKSSVFEQMGFTYFGPVNGHDLEQLTHMLRLAKEWQGPVLLHVQTAKGHGYSYAEANPGKYHGIGAFYPETGETKKQESMNFSKAFGDCLTELAQEDSRICAVSAAMVEGTGLDGFAKQFPERTFDVGIAEGHAVAMCAGMAKEGFLPVFCVYSTFLQRAYDMLLHDVSLQKLHVVFGVDRAGLVGADGETHHGCFDAAFLATIPHMTVLCPANYAELRKMLKKALYEIEGPVAIRYPRGGEGKFLQDTSAESAVEIEAGQDVTLVTYGSLVNEAVKAAEELKKQGISASVIKCNQIVPLEADTLCRLLGGKKNVIVIEESSGEGCVGERLSALLLEQGIVPQHFRLLNFGDSFAPQGTVEQLWHQYSLDAAGMVKVAQEVCR